MIRAANHSSYPKRAGGDADEQMVSVLAARERGEATDDEVAAARDEMTGIVVAEQSRAFINIVTSGMIHWAGPLGHVARGLDGFDGSEPVAWPGTEPADRRPVCSGPVRRMRPLQLHEYRVAADVAQSPVKVVLPGPVTFARSSEDRHYRDLGAFADALAEAWADEFEELALAGARHFQLDEPLLCRHPEDLELVVRTAGRVFAAAGSEATTVLSTYGGDLTGVAKGLERLPGTHLGLDLVRGPANRDLLGRLPAGKGVVLGLFDAATGKAEDAAEVAGGIEPLREALTGRDVIVGPQSGLGQLADRDDAFDKLLQTRYLVETLNREWCGDS